MTEYDYRCIACDRLICEGVTPMGVSSFGEDVASIFYYTCDNTECPRYGLMSEVAHGVERKKV